MPFDNPELIKKDVPPRTSSNQLANLNVKIIKAKMKTSILPPFSVMCSFHRLISPAISMFRVHTRKRKAKDEIPEVKQLIIPRTHDSHMHETVHKFYVPYHKITMASLRLLYVLSHSLSSPTHPPRTAGFSYLCERVCR